MWYRVFGGNEVMPDPAAILDHLHARGDFATDQSGWYQAELLVEGAPLRIERFLASEEGMRGELNSWAAWLETCEEQPAHVPLMERMIQTKQLFTLECPVEKRMPLCASLCQLLAGITEGVYQVDGQGFLAADGTLLLEER